MGSREAVSNLNTHSHTSPNSCWKAFRPSSAPISGGFSCHQSALDLDSRLMAGAPPLSCSSTLFIGRQWERGEHENIPGPHGSGRKEMKDCGCWSVWGEGHNMMAGVALPQQPATGPVLHLQPQLTLHHHTGLFVGRAWKRLEVGFTPPSKTFPPRSLPRLESPSPPTGIFSLSLNLRGGPRPLRFPLVRCLPASTRGSCGKCSSLPQGPHPGMGSGQGAWFEP